MVYGNKFLNEGFNSASKIDLKNITEDDIKDTKKFKEIMYKLEKENDERKVLATLDAIIRLIIQIISLATLSTPIAFTISALNILYSRKIAKSIPKSKTDQILKRLNNRLNKTKDESEKKKIEAIIDKINKRYNTDVEKVDGE